MRSEIDWILTESVLVGASEALDDIGAELAALRDGWAEMGASAMTLRWADDLILRAGWWSGRLLASSVKMPPS